MNARNILITASISGAIAVGLGAFGAHALKDFLIENSQLDTYKTAVSYHFYHTLLLFGIGVLMLKLEHSLALLKRAGLFISMGILIFSGSLYFLCFTNVGFLGAITPFGGVFLILGWFQLALAAIKLIPQS